MKTYVVYFSTGHGMDQSIDIEADDVRHAVDLFVRDQSPVATILAIIEKVRTL